MTTLAATVRRRQNPFRTSRSTRTQVETRGQGGAVRAQASVALVRAKAQREAGLPFGVGATNGVAVAVQRAGGRAVAGSHAARTPDLPFAPWVGDCVRRPRPATILPGQRFAGLRARRALEVTGSCIMLLGFLALAILG